MIRRLFATANDYSLTVLRLVLGAVFVVHGAQKMLGWFGGYGYHATMAGFTGRGIPAFLAFLAIAAEFFGGIGLIVGLLSRVAALGILCNMVVAIAAVHAKFGFFMNWAGNQKGEGYEYHLLAMAICFAIALKGSGALSLDRVIAGNARESEAAPRVQDALAA